MVRPRCLLIRRAHPTQRGPKSRFVPALVVAVLTAGLLALAVPTPGAAGATPPAPAQVWAEPDDPDGLLDDDLLRAIRRLGLVQWWTETAQIDMSLAFLRVLDRSDLAVRRAELIQLGESVVHDQAEITVAGLDLHAARRRATSADTDLASVAERIDELTEQRDARRRAIESLRPQGHPGGSVDATLARIDASAVEAAALARVIERLETASTSALAAVERLDALIATAEAAIAELVDRRQVSRERAQIVAAELLELRATQVVPGPDLPLVAIEAYQTGARFGTSCGIDWTVLAGIGWIESQHGTYHGAQLLADGTLSDPILGIRLDGSRSAVITDSDQGRLDGDTSYDRAVGPMQFIPSTWTRHGVDGDRDGTVDPQDLHDAAATAATYLCRVGQPSSSLRTRLLGYNNSNSYVGDVQRAAQGFAGIDFPVFATSRTD